MAYTDNTRVDNYNQKKAVCQMVIRVGEDEYKSYLAAGNFLVGILPPKAIITDAYVHTVSASDAAAIALGTAEGGTEILSVGDSTTLGKTGTFTGQSETGSGVEVYMSTGAAATQGDFVAIIEYVEYTLNTGNLTKIN